MDNERKILPKQAFDSEYMTEYLREVRFLNEKGIKYSFVKKTRDYGVSQYKYKKSPALFAALVEFYSMLEAEKAVAKKRTGGLVSKEIFEKNIKPQEELLLSPEQVKKAQEILEAAVKQAVIQTKEAEKDDTL